MAWRRVDGPIVTVFSNIIEMVGRQFPFLIPSLSRAPEVAMASDYGGTHQSATHRSYSILIVDQSAMSIWDTARKRVREAILHDRRMSYKGLSDGVKRRALHDFLAASNALPGLLLTVLVNRQIPTILGPENLSDLRNLLPHQANLPGNSLLERMARVSLFASFAISGLLRDGQRIQWITDVDDIIANKVRREQMLRVIERTSASCEPTPEISLRLGSTAQADASLVLEDLAAIPDLAAGSLGTIVGSAPGMLSAMIAGLALPRSDTVRSRDREIMSWLAWKRAPLKRWCFAIEPATELLEFSVALLRLHDADDPV